MIQFVDTVDKFVLCPNIQFLQHFWVFSMIFAVLTGKSRTSFQFLKMLNCFSGALAETIQKLTNSKQSAQALYDVPLLLKNQNEV